MKYFKKSIFLTLILVAFVVSCTKAQQALNSSFDVIEDGTQDPSTPPVDITPDPSDNRREFPSEAELYIKSTNYNIDKFNSSYSVEFKYVGKDVQNLLRRTKDTRVIQKTLIERTTGFNDVEKLLKAVYLTTDHLNGRFNCNALNIGADAYDALSSQGQFAKIRIQIFIEDEKTPNNETRYKTGSRMLWVTIKRNN